MALQAASPGSTCPLTRRSLYSVGAALSGGNLLAANATPLSKNSLNPEATLSSTLLLLRIEAPQVLLDVRSDAGPPVWYPTQDVLRSDLERRE